MSNIAVQLVLGDGSYRVARGWSLRGPRAYREWS